MSEAQEPKCRVVFAPQSYPTGSTAPKIVFLSGTIHYADPSTDWRVQIASALSHLPVTILNPHRSDWDGTWKESIDFLPFKHQVNWELGGMEDADVLAVYFGSNTEAPITLMELGLSARERGTRVVVACAAGYKRKGNIQVVCDRYGIQLVETMDELAAAITKKLKELKVDGA